MLGLGALLALLLRTLLIVLAVVNHFCDKLYHKNVARKGPEARLYTAMVGGVLLPLGSFIYAWTAFAHIHWIAPMIGISIL